MLPIGIQLYSVREEAEKDIESVLRELKRFGYDGVELCGFYGRTPKEMKSLLDEIGLKAVSAHVDLNLMRADMGKVIEDYKTVGCEFVVVPWLAEADRMDGENGEKTVEEIEAFAKMAEAAGVPLCYHNHEFEFDVIDGEYAFDRLFARVPNLMVEQDSCWVAVSGESPAEYLRKYSGRTPLLHLKDYCGSRKNGDLELRPNGYGVQNFAEIISVAEENGVRWLVVEQDTPSMDKTALECAKLSIDYLKTINTEV